MKNVIKLILSSVVMLFGLFLLMEEKEVNTVELISVIVEANSYHIKSFER